MNFRRALRITAVSQLVLFLLGIANVVIVSRLLAPEEIGIFSVAVSILGFAHILREFGVGQYLVKAASVSRDQFRAAFAVAIIASWSIAAILFAVKDLMASFYGHHGISEVLLLLAVNFLVLPIGTPVLAMMKRDLQFGPLAWIAIFGAVVQTAVTIGAAMAGESYLSMAWGSLAMTLSKMLLVNVIRPGETFILPATSGLRDVLRFGSLSSFTSIVKEFGTAAPDLILGRTLGFADVAIFSRGMGVHRMIVERINILVRNVHFPTFAADLRSGRNGAELYANTTNYLLAVTGPVLAVLAILSEPLIIFMFGAQWERSVPIAAVLCSASILTAPYSLYGISLTAASRVSTYLLAEVVAQGVRILVLLTSIWLSLEEVVGLLVAAYLLEAVVAQMALRRAFDLSWLMLMRRVWRALAVIPFSAAGPALIVWGGVHYGYEDAHRLAVIVSSSALAMFGWAIGVMLLRHPMRAELVRIWQSILLRARPRPSGT